MIDKLTVTVPFTGDELYEINKLYDILRDMDFELTETQVQVFEKLLERVQHRRIFLMAYDSEHYYAVQTFLDDDELCKIWNIIEIAMNREGYDVENAELSMRLYDQELTENIEHDMENLL